MHFNINCENNVYFISFSEISKCIYIIELLGRQQRPPSIEARQEPRQVANVASQGAPTPPEPAARRPLKPRQQPPPNRPRPRPIRPRPTRGRPQKGIFGSVKDAVNRAKCEATKFVSKQMLNDERFIQTQINCVLDKGECDETGAMIKRNIVFLFKEIDLVLNRLSTKFL